MPNQAPLTVEQALRRQRRLLVFGGVILVAQLLNTAVLWVSLGRFPVWAGVALVGVWIFYVMLLRQHRRLRALTPPEAAKPRKKRKRLRDPHRAKPERP
jgi:O-antigen/teichoic acid export membrane protein